MCPVGDMTPEKAEQPKKGEGLESKARELGDAIGALPDDRAELWETGHRIHEFPEE